MSWPFSLSPPLSLFLSPSLSVFTPKSLVCTDYEVEFIEPIQSAPEVMVSVVSSPAEVSADESSFPASPSVQPALPSKPVERTDCRKPRKSILSSANVQSPNVCRWAENRKTSSFPFTLNPERLLPLHFLSLLSPPVLFSLPFVSLLPLPSSLLDPSLFCELMAPTQLEASELTPSSDLSLTWTTSRRSLERDETLTGLSPSLFLSRLFLPLLLFLLLSLPSDLLLLSLAPRSRSQLDLPLLLPLLLARRRLDLFSRSSSSVSSSAPNRPLNSAASPPKAFGWTSCGSRRARSAARSLRLPMVFLKSW